MRRGELSTLQAGRAFAALAVLMFHSHGAVVSAKYGGVQIGRIFEAGDSGVAFFFVLSGAVMVLAHRAQLGAANNPGPFLWKRFRRIYPPLWAALILVLVSGRLLFGMTPPAGDVISAFLISPAPTDYILTVEWTLRHEVLFYLLFAGALWRPKIGFPVLALWCLASVPAAAFRLPYPAAFFLAPQHLLFAFGMATAALPNRMPVASTIAGGGLFAATWLLVAYGFASHVNPFVIWAYGLGAALTISGLAALETAGRVTAPRWMVTVGAASYAIYLIHFPAVSLAAKIGSHFGLAPALKLAWVAVFALLVGLAFHWLVERPLLRLGRFQPRARLASVT